MIQRSVFDSQGRYVGRVVRQWEYDPRPHRTGVVVSYWQSMPYQGAAEGRWPDTAEGVLAAVEHTRVRAEEIRQKIAPRRPPDQMKLGL